MLHIRGSHDKQQNKIALNLPPYTYTLCKARTSKYLRLFLSSRAASQPNRRPLWGPLVARQRSSHDSRSWAEQNICSTSAKATGCSCWGQRLRGSFHPEITRFRRNKLGSYRRTNTPELLTKKKNVALIHRKVPTRYLHVAVVMGVEPDERGEPELLSMFLKAQDSRCLVWYFG